ncbi:hypothetical protein, partial [Janthinobacterium lividum]|uniref:hypothetical protein n=1 Tax=Janthinobacterium lividum TaxID=29581 RepID=UPI001966CE96
MPINERIHGQLHQVGTGQARTTALIRDKAQLDDCISSNTWRVNHQTKKNPTIADRVFLLLRITSLTITYFH